MPEQAPTAPVPSPPASQEPKPITSASEYLQQTDDELAARIVRKSPEPPQNVAVEAAPPAAETPVAEAPDTEAPKAEPEPKAAPQPPPKLLTEFVVKDAEGEIEIPVELRFDFKANGKDYTDVPLDKVVKMAQMGFYNEEREQHVLAAKKFVAEAQQERQRLTQALEEYDRHVDRLLTDEAFRQRAIELYQQQHSPEARASRAEQELQRTREQQRQQQEAQQVAAFVQAELTPRFQQFLSQYPTVNQDELLGRWTALTAPLMVNGRVPTERFPELIRLVDGELQHWAAGLHEERANAATQQRATAQEATKQVALAKRSLARKVAPPPASAPAAPQKRKFSSAAEWLNAALPMEDQD